MNIRTKIAVIATSMVLAFPTVASAQSSVIEGVTPVENADGTQYQVEPTLSGGRVGSSALSSSPAGELEQNGVPASESIINQLVCHVIFAPFKTTWNLEDYRPNVTWPALISSRCNPN